MRCDRNAPIDFLCFSGCQRKIRKWICLECFGERIQGVAAHLIFSPSLLAHFVTTGAIDLELCTYVQDDLADQVFGQKS
jgi:hypothetical protein